MSDIQTINMDDLWETWALRGHPVLMRKRWQRAGVDLDDDDSVSAFCATAEGGDAIYLLVDLASMSEEPELNRRAEYAAARVAELYPDDRPMGENVFEFPS